MYRHGSISLSSQIPENMSEERQQSFTGLEKRNNHSYLRQSVLCMWFWGSGVIMRESMQLRLYLLSTAVKTNTSHCAKT